MKAMPEAHLKELTRYFEKRTDVAFAFLYGSHARGTATRRSDVDLAVYFFPLPGTFDYQADTDYAAEREVWADTERLLGSEVELLVLNRASPNIAASALRGTSLCVKDWGLYVDFMLHATGEAEEYRESVLEDFLRERR